MKVLFAVNNEDVSESIIKLYQKEYKEIISGKNVYYFNAIIKELQRDQTYDRVVISEDLEPHTNSNLSIINKLLFEQLDKISDEAISDSGTDIPIIFIATDRRSKSDDLLSKLFSIGIYDALLGQDRSVAEVCKLINKPRTKKEAKVYYKIETEEVTYQAQSEDSVSETEIQNILTHYKKLGKDTERYVESFNNIAAQYTDAQLRVISKFLPIGVRAVLETESPKYQSIMTFGEGTYKEEKNEKKDDLKIGFIETNNTKARPTKPVVIPSAVNSSSVKKLTKKVEKKEEKDKEKDKDKDKVVEEAPSLPIYDDLDDMFEEEDTILPEVNIDATENTNIETENETKTEELETVPDVLESETDVIESEANVIEPEPILEEEPVKRKRGRPRKIIEPGTEEVKVPKKRGRPRKVVLSEDDADDKTVLSGYREPNDNSIVYREELEEAPNLFGISGEDEQSEEKYIENVQSKPENVDLNRLLTKDKKIVAFVGTSKAGTSFLVNNLADMLSGTGIKTAIVDLTENRNSYYIYTKNEEPLRRVASNCLEKLENGIVEGIDVSKNLSIFTSIPNQKLEINNIKGLLANLVKKYSLVLLDCDFKTPYKYFELAQEIYLIQTMDILTIQPLTAFLRDLQSTGKLDPSKLKVIINKFIKVRGLSSKVIIGGMSCYNNPEMSYMRELFDKDKIQWITVPFDEDALSKYLSGMVDCYVRTDAYSKLFIVALKKLGEYVYPLVANKVSPDFIRNNRFARRRQEADKNSNNLSDAINQMKKDLK